MAQDVSLGSQKYGPYEDFRAMNPILAKDQKLVDAIVDFMGQYPALRWGGSFGSGSDTLPKGTLPTGRGITEFHHFEFKGGKMPKFFKKYEDELRKVRMKSGQLTDTTSLAKLYKALAESSTESIINMISERKSSQRVHNLYIDIANQICENLAVSLSESYSRSFDGKMKNILSHEDFITMAMIDIKNDLVSMKRRGATVEDMIEVLENVLRDLKSGYTPVTGR